MGYNFDYKLLIKAVLAQGTAQEGRNGDQLIIPHYSFTIENMKDDHKLLLRKMYYKGIAGEFNTLIDPTPLTNVAQFEKNGCNYWKNWSDKHGNINIDYHNQMHPRLENLIYDIRKDPNSRRHRLELWNQDNVDNCVLSLPCCWHGLTFTVIDKKLHLTWTQRSVDVAIGFPSDVYLAYLFMNYVALKTDLEVGSCMFALSNVHLYAEHLANARLLLSRDETDYDNPMSFQLKA